MNRATVLIGCLAAAGAVAAYTHSTREADEPPPPTFTVHVPDRAAHPVPSAAPTAPVQRPAVPPGDRVALARALQRELRRVGCYGGDVNGVWTTSSRMAMKSFVDHVNAALPIDDPDQILLSLVQGHHGTACGSPCPPEQAADGGRCMGGTQSAKAAGEGAPPAFKPETPAEEARNTTLPAATAAAAAAVAPSAAAAKGAPKPDVTDGRAGPAPTPGDNALKGDRSGGQASGHSGPVPPERVHKRRARRTPNQAKPPKFVRNIMRAFGIR